MRKRLDFKCSPPNKRGIVQITSPDADAMAWLEAQESCRLYAKPGQVQLIEASAGKASGMLAGPFGKFSKKEHADGFEAHTFADENSIPKAKEPPKPEPPKPSAKTETRPLPAAKPAATPPKSETKEISMTNRERQKQKLINQYLRDNPGASRSEAVLAIASEHPELFYSKSDAETYHSQRVGTRDAQEAASTGA